MSDSSLQAQFREKLLHLLRTEFRGLSEQELYSAFATVVQDLRTNVGIQTPPRGQTPTAPPAPAASAAPAAPVAVARETDPKATVVLPSPDLDGDEIVSDSWDLDFEGEQASLDRSFGPSVDGSAGTSMDPDMNGDDVSADPASAARDAQDVQEPQEVATPVTATEAEAATAVEQAAEESASPGVEAATAVESPGMLGTKTYLNPVGGGWTLAFDVFTSGALEDLAGQLAGTNGLFVQLEQEVELNATVDVCLVLPVTGEELWWEGRVVFQSPSGTAIDVKPATTDWREIIGSAQALFSATNVVPSTPSGGPRTEPPRLRRSTASRKRPTFSAAELEAADTPSPPVDAGDRAASRTVPASPQAPPPPVAHRGADPPSSAPNASGQAPHGGAPSYPSQQAPPPQYGHGAQQPPWPPAQQPPQSPWAQAPTGQVAPPPPGQLNTRSIRAVIKANAPSVSGTIDDQHPLSLYVTDIASRQEDGLAVIKGDVTYFLVMQVGCPVDIRMEPRNPDLHLGSLLVQAGALTWEAHKEAERFAHDRGCSYDAALVQLRHLPYQQSLAALQSRMVYVLGHIFQEVHAGEFAYYDLGPLPQRYGTPPVSIGQIGFKYVFERWKQKTAQQLDAVVEAFTQFYVRKVVPPPIPLAEIQLSKKHKRFWDVVLAEDNKVKNVPSISNLGHADTLSMILTLRDLGFLRFEEGEQVDGQIARARARLGTMYDKIGNSTHYELLSLHWSAYTEIVTEAYEAHKKEFSPEAWPDEILADSRHRLEEIQEALDAAYEVLKDKKTRTAYRETIVNSMQLLNGVQLYFRKGDMAMLRRDARESLMSFQRVLELEPRHKGARQKVQMIRDAERKAKE